MITYGSGTEGDPWVLKTPSLASEFPATIHCAPSKSLE